MDRAGRFVPGTQPTILTVGAARLALTMCYEVFDNTVRDSVTNGSTCSPCPATTPPSANTDMTYQQPAIDRFRAVEHGRTVIVATSGVSAIILPDGTITRQSTLFTPAVLIDRIPLRDSLTVAARIGPLPQAVVVSAAVGVLAAAAAGRRPRHAQASRSRHPPT